MGKHRTTYTEAIASEICRRMALGETLTEICDDARMPHKETIWDWRRKHPDFEVAYQKAREDQVHAWADQIVGLVDTAIPDRIEVPLDDPRVTIEGARKKPRNGRVVIWLDRKHLGHVREMVKVRQWVMSRIAPQHYGDRQTIHNVYSAELRDDSELIADLADAMRQAAITPQELVDMLQSALDQGDSDGEDGSIQP